MNIPGARCLRVLSVASACAVCCCAVRATVVDVSKHETQANRVRLEQEHKLKVLNGGILVQVPLRSVKAIDISMAESITFERELYYGARVEMRDGTVYRSDPRTARSPTELTYVCVNDVLVGKTRRGKMSVGLDKVLSVTFR